jgi:hypothetical protein
MTKIIIPILLTALLSCNAPKNKSTERIPVNNSLAIKLKNPSFEDEPRAAQTPADWTDCGFQGESPPDVQPNPTFNVIQKAFHGKTYLGFVVRDVGTYEGLGQKLHTPLSKDTCYSFSAYLSRSTTYESLSQLTRKRTYYNTSCVLRIWAGNKPCENGELIATSTPISNSNWQIYKFTLAPKQSWKFFKLEAYYAGDKANNGNLLIDNLSDITPCPCAKSEK